MEVKLWRVQPSSSSDQLQHAFTCTGNGSFNSECVFVMKLKAHRSLNTESFASKRGWQIRSFKVFFHFFFIICQVGCRRKKKIRKNKVSSTYNYHNVRKVQVSKQCTYWPAPLLAWIIIAPLISVELCQVTSAEDWVLSVSFSMFLSFPNGCKCCIIFELFSSSHMLNPCLQYEDNCIYSPFLSTALEENTSLFNSTHSFLCQRRVFYKMSFKQSFSTLNEMPIVITTVSFGLSIKIFS